MSLFLVRDAVNITDVIIDICVMTSGFLVNGLIGSGLLAGGFLASGFLASGFLASGFLAVAFWVITPYFDRLDIRYLS